MQKTLIFLLVISFVLPNQCMACLWDYDTLRMEQQRFPETHELIAGYFIRHSADYYQWRIDDRAAIPNDQRTPMNYDDIAVAHDKLGQQDKAIETILAKIERWPNQQRYESEANLGTFHIHAGRFKEGLKHIEKAIEINPEAHFGREIYQKLLVEYLIQKRAADSQSDLSGNDETPQFKEGFAEFVLAARKPGSEKSTEEIKAAIKGVLGMMRFGHYDSPVLLGALGDLLASHRLYSNDAKRLAARAYLKAAIESDDEEIAAAYRQKANSVLGLQVMEGNSEIKASKIEADLRREIAQGDRILQEITSNEQAWIANKSNLDVEFEKKYHTLPPLVVRQTNRQRLSISRRQVLLYGSLAVIGIVLAGVSVRFLSRTITDSRPKY